MLIVVKKRTMKCVLQTTYAIFCINQDEQSNSMIVSWKVSYILVVNHSLHKDLHRKNKIYLPTKGFSIIRFPIKKILVIRP